MKKVVVAGCLCLDITPEFHDSQEKRKNCFRVVSAGQTSAGGRSVDPYRGSRCKYRTCVQTFWRGCVADGKGGK